MLSVVRRRLPLGERSDVAELLDSGRLSRSEVEANLADLTRLNRLPGGTVASIGAIERLLGRDGNAARILDVGTGAADMPNAFAQRGWEVVALDSNPDVLAVARRASVRRGVTVVEAEATSLPFPDASFDVAHASLLIHHLAPADAVTALREMRRVSRLGVVVNDLRRGLIPMAATMATVAVLARSRVTRADGLASSRRAYTLAELDRLLVQAGLRRRWRSSAWMPRVVTAAAP